MKKTLPLNPDGTVDFSKVDPSNDFDLFPKMFSSIDDIEKFVYENRYELPLIRDIIDHLKKDKLELTPTETKWYSDEMFDYIYDVYRVPIPQTKQEVFNWLTDYVSEYLRNYGFEYFKKESFRNCKMNYDTQVRFDNFTKERGISVKDNSLLPKEINYYPDIPTDLSHYNDYYICNKETVIEQFWIRSATYGIPFWVAAEKEAYMRVWVFPTYVYIFGHDDYSWTLETKTEQEAKEFSHYLKCGAPVWNFEYASTIHKDLEFTN